VPVRQRGSKTRGRALSFHTLQVRRVGSAARPSRERMTARPPTRNTPTPQTRRLARRRALSGISCDESDAPHPTGLMSDQHDCGGPTQASVSGRDRTLSRRTLPYPLTTATLLKRDPVLRCGPSVNSHTLEGNVPEPRQAVCGVKVWAWRRTLLPALEANRRQPRQLHKGILLSHR
jgi:hypothetical protein